VGLATLALAVSLAACGQLTAGNEGPAGGQVPTSTPAQGTPPASSHFNRATVDGCPAQQAPADAASFRPDIVATQNGGPSQAISLTGGQRLEIRLDPHYRWQLATSDPDHTLTSTATQGWYDGSLDSCVWQFTAASAGSAQLSYRGSIVCPPLELCPADEQAVSYQVAVR
jgi:hypothetical protein